MTEQILMVEYLYSSEFENEEDLIHTNIRRQLRNKSDRLSLPSKTLEQFLLGKM